MRCLVLSDSLALPRKYRSCTVRWSETYVHRLTKAYPADEFILAGIGGATIVELFLQLGYYVHTEPDVVILHCGIVDCAPRALRKWELQVAGRLHLYPVIKPFTTVLRRYRHLRYTSPKRFEETLKKMRATFGERPLVAIGILPSSPAHEAIVPGIGERIEMYNEMLERHTTFIDTRDFPPAGMIEDFIHLNALGHQVIFDKLSAVLQQVRPPAARTAQAADASVGRDA